MKCEVCGEEFKNLGVHMRVHQTPEPSVKIDVPTEKPISELIAGIKALLRPYNFTIHVSYDESNGIVTGAEIHAGIQIRR